MILFSFKIYQKTIGKWPRFVLANLKTDMNYSPELQFFNSLNCLILRTPLFKEYCF